MKKVPYMSNTDLAGEIFVHAPNDEDMRVSVARLARAIRRDGINGFFSPASVWYAYAKHPSLSKPYNQVLKEYYDKCNKQSR